VYYNFAAGSFLSKKLCSRLHSIEVDFIPKKEKFAFSAILWQTYGRISQSCDIARLICDKKLLKMRIFTYFLLPLSRIFLIATGLQLICEFAAHSSQTSRNVIANSQCIRKLFSRRSCDIHMNVARTSHD